jgi:acetyltransferase-like isoleucine patch superfamily enzyme
MSDISKSAVISKKARIGENVTIGPFTTIYDNVDIQNNVNIGAYCELGLENINCDGSPLIIGSDSLIRSHSIFYADSTFRCNLITGHRVTVREKTHAGCGLQLGTLSDVQGDCTFGDYVKLHSNVHIGSQSKVGSYVWIFPYVVLTNDPHPPSDTLMGCVVDDYAVIATMSTILPGVHIEKDTLIAAGSIVGKDVKSGTVVAGNPAKVICGIDKIILKDGSGNLAYPWRRHFHRGYPEATVQNWLGEFTGK